AWEKRGIAARDSGPQALTAWWVAARTCRTSGNMSGASRALSSTDGSTFFASAKAAALSSTADKLVRNCTKIGTDDLYMEMVMAGCPFKIEHEATGVRVGNLGLCLKPVETAFHRALRNIYLVGTTGRTTT